MPSENTVHIAIELSFSSWLVAARRCQEVEAASNRRRRHGGAARTDRGAALARPDSTRRGRRGGVLLRGGSGRVLAASAADGARHTCLRARADQYPGEPTLASSQNRPARR